MSAHDPLLRLLALARWAPSGDNTQPWRFEILANDHLVVHGHDTRHWCLYDFNGHASHMAHGALLETLRIAATGEGLEASWALRAGCHAQAPIYDVRLRPSPDLAPDPLLPFVRRRRVQRRAMRLQPLTLAQCEALAAAPGAGYTLRFFESTAERHAMARLLWRNAGLRLTCPEAYPVHKEVIDWGRFYSRDRIPERAVGVDPVTGRLMRWVMGRWSRVQFFNRFLGGTIAPRLQLDYLPALACSAHVLMLAERPVLSLEDHVGAGVAMQRLWLSVTALGLQLQPQMTPLIFRWYTRAGRAFSADPRMGQCAAQLAQQFAQVGQFGPGDEPIFFCRVGSAVEPRARSWRQRLDTLMKPLP